MSEIAPDTFDPDIFDPELTSTDAIPVPDDGPFANLPARRDAMLPPWLTILPLSNRPLFPGLIVPLVYEGGEHIETLRKMAKSGQIHVGLVLVRDDEKPLARNNLFQVGVVARILKAAEIEGHGLHVIVECLERFQALEFVSKGRVVRARVQYHRQTNYENNVELRAYTVAIINTIKELLKHNPLYEEELKMFLSRFGPDEPNHLADFAASLTSADRDELQAVLETFPIFDRLKKVMTLLNRELNVSKLQSRIRRNIDEKVSEQQRKFFLKLQLTEIQKELGLSEEPQDQEIKRFKGRLRRLKLSTEAREKFDEELEKLAMLEPGSPEYGVTRNYLDWMTTLPWGRSSKDKFDLATAAKSLDKHHSGLEDVKERILEFIAVGGRKKDVGGSIVLFVGPPGVGKTSVGRAIASALGRPFYRFSVGGMRDEAEIKGHRRTYIGAMPGKILQALKQVKANNPVLMIDEVDKIGNDYRGDPSSALLEVLDPEQNNDFLDHYLDARFDLSKVLFLLTANQLDTVPPALLDRAEIIRLPGYMSHEKVAIGEAHLWPRLLKKHVFKRTQVKLPNESLSQLVSSYAREPGVRQLEQLMEKILRKLAREVAEAKRTLPYTVTPADLPHWIGKPRFTDQRPSRGVGITTGLAWTAMGGSTLTLEALIYHKDSRGLKITGQLGKVMQESAEIALSYITANSQRYGVPDKFFDSAFVHIHVPEGAVPKDGPSAGITLATSLLSLARNEIPAEVAMTGELTLSGEVLPIGGVREKLLAAKRMGLMTVILPAQNQVDVDELPASVAEGMTLHFVGKFDDAERLLFPKTDTIGA